MKSTALVFWLALALAATGSYGGWIVFRHLQEKSANSRTIDDEAASAQGEADRLRTNIPAGGPIIPAFKLIDQNGKPFDSRNMLGKVWVASFFYTQCPGPCFRLNQALAAVQTDKKLDDVKFVSITCDPADDTPEEMRNYAARFAADFGRWTFLTGKDEEETLKIGRESFVVPMATKTHSELAVVLDRQCRIRGYFHLGSEAEVNRMRKRLREMLAEAYEPAKEINGDSEPALPQVERAGTSAASRYRQAGGVVQAGSEVAHVVDLQLGGGDNVSSIWP